MVIISKKHHSGASLFVRALLGSMLLLISSYGLAGVNAYLNQTTVNEGDQVTLTIESDNKATQTPNLNALKQDFEILHTAQASQTKWVNGVTSSSKTWTVYLLPKHKGEINIPSIALGQETTQPLKLVVTDIPVEQVHKNSEYMTLEASVEIGKSLPYVQQQIPYVIKLFTDESVSRGDLYAPNIENATIEQISRDKQYNVVRNGKKLNVLERHYVISAEKSGQLMIPPAIFKGERTIPNSQKSQNTRRLDPNSFFNDPFFNTAPFGSLFRDPGKPVTTRSDSIEIDIQPLPSAYKGSNWLPAEELIIEDSWEKFNPTFKVGEPIVRILTLQTKGLTGAQIPDISVDEPPKIRVYEDDADTQTKTDGKTVYGIRKQSFNYIPNAAGKVTIPAVNIDWWNVITKQQEIFTLPEREVEILAGAGGVEKSNNVASSRDEGLVGANSSNNLDSVKDDQIKEDPIKAEEISSKANNNGLFLAIIMGVVSLMALYFFWQRRSKKLLVSPIQRDLQKGSSRVEKVKNASKLLNELQQACATNNKKLTATLLLQLAEKQWVESPPKNLGGLADRLIQGSELVRELDQSLYAGAGSYPAADGSLQASSMLCAQIWDVMKEGLLTNKKSKNTEREVIASLYPSRN